MARKGLPLFFIHPFLYPSDERNADAHAQAAPPPRQRTLNRNRCSLLVSFQTQTFTPRRSTRLWSRLPARSLARTTK